MSHSKKVMLTLGVLGAITVADGAGSGDAPGLVVFVGPPAVLMLAVLAGSVKDRLRMALGATLLVAAGVWLRYSYLLLLTLFCDDNSSCYADRNATASAWGIVLLAVLGVASPLAIVLMTRALQRRQDR